MICNRFVDENGNTPGDLECLLCKKTVFEPKVCEHDCVAIMCGVCCIKVFESKKECPFCKRHSVYKELSLREAKFLNRLQLMCIADECPTQGQLMTFEALKTHQCKPKEAQCPLGCGKMVAEAT